MSGSLFLRHFRLSECNKRTGTQLSNMKIKGIFSTFPNVAFSLFTLILRSTISTHSTMTHTASTRATWIPETCPTVCNCSLTFSWILSRSLRTVDCRDLDLDLPPMNISSEAEAIVLSGNRLLAGSLALLRDLVVLTELTIVGCHVHSLEDLVLGGHDWTLGSRVLNADRNLLTQLHDGSFINLAELETLILSNNRIEKIHSKAFTGLTRLTSLDLGGNRLTTLDDARWLCHVRHVTTVDLSANGIHVIPRFAFRCLSLLRTLDVSRNRIRHVDDEAFYGLRQLRHLSMDDNVLPVIPSDAISQLTGIVDLSLSGNAFAEIASDSFRSTATMTSLRLNRMSELRLVDRWAFRNMTSLERLEMSGNRRLKYIHPEAFQGLRSLRELDLERSAVESIEAEVGDRVPSLSVLRLRSAPLVCDCVIAWLVRRLTSNNQTGNGSDAGFLSGAAEARCQSPAELKDIRVAEVALDEVAVPCGPRILPLFSREVNVTMADPVKMQCRAVGVPMPRSFWISHSNFSLSLPPTFSHQAATNQLNGSDEEILQVDSASIEDQGTYTCSAVSSQGRDQRQVFLRIQPLNVSLLIIRSTVSSITVTWRGTDHTRDYTLAYRKLADNSTSAAAGTAVPIKHYMRSFTASELPPETEYEFCVGIRRPPTNHFRSVNCTVASTRNRKYDESRFLSRRDPYAAGMVVVVVVVVFGAVVCLSSTAVCSAKTFDRTKRHLQEAPSPDRMFLSSLEGGGGGNNMAPETYENEAAESAIFDDADLDEIRNTAYMNIARSP